MELLVTVVPRDENIPSVVWSMILAMEQGLKEVISASLPVASVEIFGCSTARGRVRKPQLLWFWSWKG